MVLIGTFLTLIVFVLFGQITVKKLRKRKETKEALGIEFASGLDIINVAQALSIPKVLSKKLEASPLSFLYADSELLYKHTSKFDRFLARLFFGLFYTSFLMILSLMVLDLLGLLDK